MVTWKECGHWTMSLLSWTGFAQMYKEGRDCNPLFLEFTDNVSIYYQTEEEFTRVKKEFKEKASKTPNFLQKKLEEIKNQLSNDTKVLAEINNDLKQGKTGLSELFEKYWEEYRKTIFGMCIDIYFDDNVCKELADFLKTKVNEEKFNLYFSILTAPIKLTTTQEEELAFLRILLEDSEELFEKHIEKYCYIPMWFDNKPWTVEDLKKRSKLFQDKSEIQKRIDVLMQENKKREEESNRILEEINASEEIKELVGIIKEFAYLRQQGEIAISYHNYHGYPLRRKICEKLSISFDDFTWLTDEEIISNLKNKDPKLNQKIAERKKYCYVVMKDSKYVIYTGVESKKEANKIKSQIKEVESTEEDLKGTVGSNGYAKGKVCIICGLHELDKIKQGEILVVTATSVEYLSAMHRAAGIVCEIGGITSHAAIVARELKKPCIIRIPDVIKKLKDGELIELDTSKGIVRRLKG